MAYLSKKDFAEKCGVKMPAISAALKSKKLILMKDGKRINTRNKLNHEYFLFHQKRLEDLKKQAEKKTAKKNVSKSKGKNQPDKKAPETSKKDTSQKRANQIRNGNNKNEDEPEQLTIFDLNKIQKEKDIELKEINIKNKILENRRLSGELIPVKFVKEIVKVQSKAFIDVYSNHAESFIIQFVGENKIGVKQAAKLKKQIVDFINTAHEQSITQAQQKMHEAFELNKQSK